MTEYLVTDFLNEKEYDKKFKKRYLELPVFDNNFNFKNNIIYYKKWNNYQSKLRDIEKNLKLYDHFLKELSIFLNRYHNKNFSIRFWSIVIGHWLYWFISSISYKWRLIESLKSKKFIFIKRNRYLRFNTTWH